MTLLAEEYRRARNVDPTGGPPPALLEAAAIQPGGAELLWFLKRIWHEHWREGFLFLGSSLAALAFAVLTPFLLKDLLDGVLLAGDFSGLVRVGFSLMGLYLLASAGEYASHLLAARLIVSFSHRFRCELFERIQRADWRNMPSPGAILAGFTSDVNEAEQTLGTLLTRVATNSLLLVLSTIGILVLDWRLGIVLLLTIPLYVVASLYSSEYLRQANQQQLEGFERLAASLASTLSTLRLSKLFDLAQWETYRFSGMAVDLRKARDRVVQWEAIMVALTSAVARVSPVVLSFTAVFWSSGNKSPSER